jgi:GNAT superfamily N-acetyltransferase
VWAPENDRAAAALLERAGHKLDGEPAAMAMELREFDPELRAEIEIDHDPAMEEIGRLNDLAYGFTDDFTRALARRPDGLHPYVARLDGEAVACVGSVDNDGDCAIFFVATRPDVRGRGLAAALMTRALADAKTRGCATTSLQATEMGRPIYARLGYREFGRIQMWERRA